jgi:ribosomal protein L11 methyltransferase
MNWRQFTMQLGSLSPDLVEEVFIRHGASSVTLSDAGDDPVLEPAPGETPLWAETRITGLFGADSDLDKLHDNLLHSFRLTALPGYSIETLADRQWEREWLKDFRPMAFGKRLWVCPGEFTIDAANAIVVSLDPGLAFGTGTHPTTALCLEWLDSAEIHGRSILDFGCGSGILAIASLLLGAESATAMDIDMQAITATQQNALRNGVAGRLRATNQLGETEEGFDIVMANILAAPLVENAAGISRRLGPGGHLVLSGILASQADQVRGAYREWIAFEPVHEKDGWVRLSGQRI